MKKFEHAMMTDQELDVVAGGKGYVYFLKENNLIHYVACDRKLSNDEIVYAWHHNGILPIKKDAMGNAIPDSYQIMMGKGLRPEGVASTMKNLENMYGGCEYIEFK